MMKNKIYYTAIFIMIATALLVSAPVFAAKAALNNQEITVLAPSIQATSLTAFLGAEGFGANTTGGRGGQVMLVTNLNNSGAGSLRDCVEASGSRTCIFRLGGLITISSPLTISNPYITIAGQTAPGGGITIRTENGGDVFPIKTHDVIIRYISARPGAGGSNHGAQIASNDSEIYNIILDHVSMSWGTDSVAESWYRVRNITFQWSIFSEGLDCSTHPKGCHSKGLMIGGYEGSEDGGKGTEDVSILHNLMAHNGERNPLLQVCGIVQVVNNVTYNPYWTFSHHENNCPGYVGKSNWIGNYHKRGPDSTSNSDLKVVTGSGGGVQIYVSGNIGPSRPNDTLPDINWVKSSSRDYIVTSPAPAPSVTTTDAFTALDDVLEQAGNNRGLTCKGAWFDRRDAIDERIVNDVRNGTGRIIDNQSEVGGWITPASGTACPDADNDGLPDAFETVNVNPNDLAPSGWTWLDEYLNGEAIIGDDHTHPSVFSVVREDPNPVNTPSVNFVVTFSESMVGVDTSAPFNDFALITEGDVTGASISGVSGTEGVYTVTVSIGSGSGTIRLDITDNDTILNSDGTPLGGLGAGNGDFSSGEVYSIAPVNDDFDSAKDILALSYTDSMNTIGATSAINDPPISQCNINNGGKATVWYKYAPDFDTAIALDTKTANYDTFIAVWEGSAVDDLSFVACNNDTGGTKQSAIGLQVVGGKTYFIEVGQP